MKMKAKERNCIAVEFLSRSTNAPSLFSLCQFFSLISFPTNPFHSLVLHLYVLFSSVSLFSPSLAIIASPSLSSGQRCARPTSAPRSARHPLSFDPRARATRMACSDNGAFSALAARWRLRVVPVRTTSSFVNISSNRKPERKCTGSTNRRASEEPAAAAAAGITGEIPVCRGGALGGAAVAVGVFGRRHQPRGQTPENCHAGLKFYKLLYCFLQVLFQLQTIFLCI